MQQTLNVSTKNYANKKKFFIERPSYLLFLDPLRHVYKISNKWMFLKINFHSLFLFKLFWACTAWYAFSYSIIAFFILWFVPFSGYKTHALNCIFKLFQPFEKEIADLKAMQNINSTKIWWANMLFFFKLIFFD